MKGPLLTAGATPDPLPVARSVESAEPRPAMPLPVARAPEPGSRPSTPDFPLVQRTAPETPPVIQRQVVETQVVQRDPDPAPPAAEPAPAPPPQAAPAPAAAAQPETDELVKKLFDPLLRRLKTELRLDRERRGALTDRPH